MLMHETVMWIAIFHTLHFLGPWSVYDVIDETLNNIVEYSTAFFNLFHGIIMFFCFCLNFQENYIYKLKGCLMITCTHSC